MPITKEKKKDILDNLGKIFKDSGSVVFLNFHGVSVADSTNIRKVLNEKKVGYFVAKKTLTKKALSENKFQGEMPAFEGELGIAYSKDLTDAAREIYQFQKKLDNKISILGGVFEGKYMSKPEMVSIALIPSLKTLHAQFVNVINSPIQGFVMALSEIGKKKTA